MLVWVIGLVQCLLPCHLGLAIQVCSSSLHIGINTIRIDLVAIVKPLFFFFRALLVEHFPQYIFLLLVRVIVLDVVVVWLVEDAI